MKKLTELQLRKLKPKDAQYDVRDNSGLLARVRPSGKIVFASRYTLRGKSRYVIHGSYPAFGLTEAKAAHFSLMSEVKKARREGKSDPSTKINPKTVEALAEEYLRRHASKLRSFGEYERVIRKYILPSLKRRMVNSVKRADVRHIVNKLQDAGKEAMAGKVQRVACSLFSYAMDQDFIDNNPARGIKIAPVKERERTLDEPEIRTLWGWLDSEDSSIRRVLKLQLLTACRHGELRLLTYDEIDGQWATIPASRMKAKKTHRVYLTRRALTVIGEGTGLIFPSEHSGSALHATSADHTLRKCGLPDIHTHDLRRTASDWMARVGVSTFDRLRVLAHSDGSIIGKHYTVYDFDREKARALEAWARKLDEILMIKHEGNILQMNR